MKTITLFLIGLAMWPFNGAGVAPSEASFLHPTSADDRSPMHTPPAADGPTAPTPAASDGLPMHMPAASDESTMDVLSRSDLQKTRAPAKKRLVVNVDGSIIQWKGTKFWGMGKHEGIVRLAEGSIFIRENAIIAGSFVIDMTTIEVTDIPKSDPVPRSRLREHLKDEHFFFIERYPTALFEISSAERTEPNRHRITGRLTMRGKTHGVHLDAHVPVLDEDALRATARFSINRHDWGVAYRGSRLTNDLVDDMIELNLVLVADAPEEL